MSEHVNRPWYVLTKSDSSMTWYEKLESRRAVIVPTLVLLMTAIIGATALRLSWSYDIYWHLQMGKDWIENGLSLYRDHLSFTFAGEEIRSPAALFEIGIYYLVEWLGLETAFKFYKFFALTLTLLLSAYWLRIIRAPVLAFVIILPLITFMMQLRALERPELIGYALIVLAMILYHRAFTSGIMSPRTMLPVVALLVFWTNYHAAILGYVIFFGLFVDFAVKLLKQRVGLGAWIRWGGWGLLVFAAGFIKPNLSHPAVEMLHFSSEWRDIIQEYAAPVKLVRLPAIYVVMLVAAAVFVYLARKRQVGLLIVISVFVYNAITTVRMVAPAGIVVLLAAGLMFTRSGLAAWVKTADRWKSGAMAAGVWSILIIALGTSVSTARSFIAANQELDSRYPANIVAYLRDSGFEGRVFNEYPLGGYLSYGLDGDAEVYIDGRTAILYSIEHLHRYNEALENPEILRNELREQDIEIALFTNHPELAKRMRRTGLLGLDFVDYQHSLYRRTNPNFPTMGFLWAEPACWRPHMRAAITEEQIRAIINLPPGSPLTPFVALAAEYAMANDREARLSVLRSAELGETVRPRFVGYRALELGAFNLAVAAFERIGLKEYRDYLASAWAHVELGDFEKAERDLDLVTRFELKEIHSSDMLVLYGLLRDIRAAGQLNVFDAEYVDALAAQVRQIDPAHLREPVTAALFCNEPDGATPQD